MHLSFKKFIEEKEQKSDYIDTMWQELGIDRDALPDIIDAPLELEDEGVKFNQSLWQLVKPIGERDTFVRIRYFNPNKSMPNFTRAYIKGVDGKWTPYLGHIPDGKEFLITIKKLSEMLSVAQKAGGANAGGGLGGGII